jgi:hypothetical protein
LVFAVPTILIFNEGSEVTRFSRHFGLDDLVRVLSILNN